MNLPDHIREEERKRIKFFCPKCRTSSHIQFGYENELECPTCEKIYYPKDEQPICPFCDKVITEGAPEQMGKTSLHFCLNCDLRFILPTKKLEYRAPESH